MLRTLFFLNILCVFLISCKEDESDKVFYESVELHSQEEIDEFGKNNYSVVLGDLEINASGEPEDFPLNLGPLSSLEQVGGNLSIYDVETLKGLENLRFVFQRLLIETSSLEGLSSLEKVFGSTVLYNTDWHEIPLYSTRSLFLYRTQMTDFSFLNNFTDLRSLYLSNTQIRSLDGIENVSSTLTSLSLRGDQSPITDINAINDLDSLQFLNISGLNNLSKVNLKNITHLEDLSINNTSTYTSFEDWFPNLEEVETISIANNQNLEMLGTFNNLLKINNFINISQNERLSDFCGLQNMELTNSSEFAYEVINNQYNPTLEELTNNTTCSSQ